MVQIIDNAENIISIGEKLKFGNKTIPNWAIIKDKNSETLNCTNKFEKDPPKNPFIGFQPLKVVFSTRLFSCILIIILRLKFKSTIIDVSLS